MITAEPAVDLAVVGAGPAGMSAATLAAQLGLSVVLLDEQDGPGGQIYRSVSASPLRAHAILGKEYWQGSALVEALLAAKVSPQVSYRRAASVWSVSADAEAYTLAYSHEGASRLVAARRILIAGGAQERPFPILGWTLPGVMTAGAAQVLLKRAAAIPEGPIALAGCGPLLYQVAAQLLRAGADLAAVFDTMQRGRMLRALPSVPGFLRSPYFARGGKLLREVNERVKIVRAVKALEAIGGDRVEALRYEAGEARGTIAIACLLLHQGVMPALNLSAAIGCGQAWNERLRHWQPRVDAWGESTVDGVFIAGDAAGIAGAEAAPWSGRIAALAIAASLGRIRPAERDEQARSHRRALRSARRGRGFFDTLFVPPPQFRMPDGDIVVCRCEEVTAGEIRALVRSGCAGPNQLKALSRCGMGPCQGRQCGLVVSEIIAQERGVDAASVGHFRVRFPVAPVTLGELASMPFTAADEAAVVRPG